MIQTDRCPFHKNITNAQKERCELRRTPQQRMVDPHQKRVLRTANCLQTHRTTQRRHQLLRHDQHHPQPWHPRLRGTQGPRQQGHLQQRSQDPRFHHPPQHRSLPQKRKRRELPRISPRIERIPGRLRGPGRAFGQVRRGEQGGADGDREARVRVVAGPGGDDRGRPVGQPGLRDLLLYLRAGQGEERGQTGLGRLPALGPQPGQHEVSRHRGARLPEVPQPVRERRELIPPHIHHAIPITHTPTPLLPPSHSHLMLEVGFNKVTASKPNRYVLLLKTPHETKRTDVSTEWTSTPHFAPLLLDDASTLEIKLCEAGLDKKIRIVGTATLPQEQLDHSAEVLFEGELRLETEVEGKMVCVGLIHLRIARQQEFEVIPEVTRQLKTEVSQVQEEEEDFALDAEPAPRGEEGEQEQEDEDCVRVEVHCGFNFFLGSEFFVEASWGQSLFRTRAIKDKLSPFWAEGGRVSGPATKPISIAVKDSKGNLLEGFKFSLSTLRTLFPYHIRLRFREEYLGATPELFLSLVRESSARHSITELPLKFGLRNVGEPVRNAMYLMLSLKATAKPAFMLLDCAQAGTLQLANNFLTSSSAGQEERVDLVGLCNNSTPKGFSLFKSYLSRKIHMQLLAVADPKAWLAGNSEAARTVDSRTDLETVLRKVYYQGESFTLKKMLEFFNPNTIDTADSAEKTMAERWKLLTRNYILRNKMVNQSTKHIQQLKETIKNKGVELVEIKKILQEIKSVNFALVGKEKLMTTIKNRSRVGSKIFAKEIDSGGLMSALYEKQAILEGQKRINAELALRMDSLTEVQENQQDLDRDITANATRLLQQQAAIAKMLKMEQAMQQQRDIIAQLERKFERSEMDKRVNEALQQQRERLDKLRERKQEDLKKVYRIVKENNQQSGSLQAKVKHAEETLIKLNEQYARLTGL